MRWFTTLAATLVLALAVGIGTGLAADNGKHKCYGNPMTTSVHRAMYMQLLADKYAPETSEAWKKTLGERAELRMQLHELHELHRGAGDKQGKDEAKDKDKHEKLKGFLSGHKDVLKERKDVMKEFTEAVRSGNEASIKAVVPKLLKSEQAMNELLRKWIAEAKK